jgi:hypothetical protein
MCFRILADLSRRVTDYCQLLITDYYCYACGPGDLKQTVVMTVGELLEELDGVDRNTEIAIATERPKGSWAIESVALVEEDGSPTIFLHCDVPRY